MEKDLLTIDQNTISINGRLNDKRLFVQPKVLIYFDKKKKNVNDKKGHKPKTDFN